MVKKKNSSHNSKKKHNSRKPPHLKLKIITMVTLKTWTSQSQPTTTHMEELSSSKRRRSISQWLSNNQCQNLSSQIRTEKMKSQTQVRVRMQADTPWASVQREPT